MKYMTLRLVTTFLILSLAWAGSYGLNTPAGAIPTGSAKVASKKPVAKSAMKSTSKSSVKSTVTKAKAQPVVVSPAKAQAQINQMLHRMKTQHHKMEAEYQEPRFLENATRQALANGLPPALLGKLVEGVNPVKANWDTVLAQFYTTQEQTLSQSGSNLAQKKQIPQSDLTYLAQGVSISQWKISQLIKLLSSVTDTVARQSMVQARMKEVTQSMSGMPDWGKEPYQIELDNLKKQEKELKASLEKVQKRIKTFGEKPVFVALGVMPRPPLAKEEIRWGEVYQAAIAQQVEREHLQERINRSVESLRQKEAQYGDLKKQLDTQEKSLFDKLAAESAQKTPTTKWDELSDEILKARKEGKPLTDLSRFDQWDKLNQQLRQEQAAATAPSLAELEQLEQSMLMLSGERNSLRAELETMQQTLQQLTQRQQSIPADPALRIFAE